MLNWRIVNKDTMVQGFLCIVRLFCNLLWTLWTFSVHWAYEISGCAAHSMTTGCMFTLYMIRENHVLLCSCTRTENIERVLPKIRQANQTSIGLRRVRNIGKMQQRHYLMDHYMRVLLSGWRITSKKSWYNWSGW